MSAKVKFVILSTLMGIGLFFVASIALAAISLAITGEGPHGYGVFLYLVLPMYLTPVGLVSGLVTSLLLKELKYKKTLLWLATSFVSVVVGTYAIFWIYVKMNSNY